MVGEERNLTRQATSARGGGGGGDGGAMKNKLDKISLLKSIYFFSKQTSPRPRYQKFVKYTNTQKHKHTHRERERESLRVVCTQLSHSSRTAHTRTQHSHVQPTNTTACTVGETTDKRGH